MTERDVRLKGPDGNGIYGRLRTNGKTRLVLHIHGLTHHVNDLLEVTSSDFFEEHGYDHYRINLYDRRPDSRKLDKTDVMGSVRDIQTVLSHFRKNYEELFITGHSFGGLLTLILNPVQVNAISLWDPATDIARFWATGAYVRPAENKNYHLDYGNVFVLSEAFVDDIAHYANEDCLRLARTLNVPTQFVIPEESLAAATPNVSWQAYADAFRVPFALQTVAEANHTFSCPGNRKNLFSYTLQWLNAFSEG